jgi:hypothetical protein
LSNQPVEIPAAEWFHLATVTERAIREAREMLGLWLVLDAQAQQTPAVIVPAGQTESGNHRFVRPDAEAQQRAQQVYAAMLMNLADALKFGQQFHQSMIPALSAAGLVKVDGPT